MSLEDQARWDARNRKLADNSILEPIALLRENLHLLPREGRVVELACGMGANIMLLAEQGLECEGWDISPVAIDLLAAAARERGLSLQGVVRDLVAEPPQAEQFDVMIISRYLERSLFAAIAAALKPGGLLFYQTYTQQHVTGGGPSNSEFRLAPNELLRAFPALELIYYREEGRVGDLDHGFRDEAELIARKPLVNEHTAL